MDIQLENVQTWTKTTRADGDALSQITITPLINNDNILKNAITALDGNTTTAYDSLNSKITETNNNLETSAIALHNEITAASDSLNTALETSATTLHNEITAASGNLNTALETSATSLQGNIDSVSGYITAHEAQWNIGTTYTAGTNIKIDSSNTISVSGMYTNTEIDNMIGAIGSFEVAPLTTGENPHPDVTEPSNKKIYLTKETGSTKKDPYTEWIYTTAKTWEIIGETTVDLSKYYTKTELTGTDGILTAYATLDDCIDIEADNGIIISANANKLKISVDPTIVSMNNGTLTFNKDVIKNS